MTSSDRLRQSKPTDSADTRIRHRRGTRRIDATTAQNASPMLDLRSVGSTPLPGRRGLDRRTFIRRFRVMDDAARVGGDRSRTVAVVSGTYSHPGAETSARRLAPGTFVWIGLRHARTSPRRLSASFPVAVRQSGRLADVAEAASREVMTQDVEQTLAALLPVRPVRPELVEEDTVFDVREPGAVVGRLELV